MDSIFEEKDSLMNHPFIEGAVFETVALSAGMWIKMLATAFTGIILNEVIKAVKRAAK